MPNQVGEKSSTEFKKPDGTPLLIHTEPQLKNVPEPRLPNLTKDKLVEGKSDLDFCIKMINEGQPVQNDRVYFYDRLLEVGLKITAGELAVTKNVNSYNLKLGDLLILATAANTFSPNNISGDKAKLLSAQELTVHQQAIKYLKTMMVQTESWFGRQTANQQKLDKFFSGVEEKVFTEPITYTRK